MTNSKQHECSVLSSGVVVVNWNLDHYNYLLLKAYNYWDFPKGVVEVDESPLQAAIREVKEETTLTELLFLWGDIYLETSPYNQGRKVARYYIAKSRTTEVQLLNNPKLGRPEHSEYRWVEHNRAWLLLTPRVRKILEWTENVIS
jgi:bis(5'-nucleosidyl)-tetraphosphatase